MSINTSYLPVTGVNFQTSDALLQKLFDTAEKKSQKNLKNFNGYTVLIEGGGYEKIWLETQPMGGEMYAKRNMTTALNNSLLFMQNQRKDGRLPGSIALIDGKITPQFNKFQGFCFPAPALEVYYLIGKNSEYLDMLANCLERFNDYLWKNRDSDGDGCLESWCRYDTGEDNALRYGDAPDAWEDEAPPQGKNVVPMASLDFMSYSYSCCDILAAIARIREDEQTERFWNTRAAEITQKIVEYLWVDERGAFFDRDNRHNIMPVLTHNTLRAMYWHSIPSQHACRFIYEHLLNPNEFWTNMPLPSVAANDPLFRNVSTNDWSGQPQALTYQRAIRALENYGFDYLIPVLSRKLFSAIGNKCVFTQQYDPFTSQPSSVSLSGKQDAYGPSMLSVLEYAARMYGVHICKDALHWGTVGGFESDYTQFFGDHTYRLLNYKTGAEAFVDGVCVFNAGINQHIVTDLSGELKQVTSFIPPENLSL